MLSSGIGGHDERMTAPEESVNPSGPPPANDLNHHPHDDRRNRLYQTAAWVAIVAGVVFIVGAVFFTGFALGRNSGYRGGGHHGRMERMYPPMMPMMGGERPNGMEGPGMRPPGNPPQPPPVPTSPARP